jgi:hypothetical protein
MKFIINYHKTSKNDSKKGKNIIYISIARNYAENRKLRGRLLITRSASRPRNHCMHGSAMQVVIGHIAFKGEMANFDLSYLRHR